MSTIKVFMRINDLCFGFLFLVMNVITIVGFFITKSY